MSAIVGALRAVLSLESAAFTRGLTSAQKGLADFDKRMKRIGGGISKVGAAISIAGAGIALAMKNQIDTADEMSKAAQKFGVPIEELSRLAHAADLSDVSFEALGASLGRLSKGMVNAPKMFADIGIAVADADGKLRPAQAVLGDLADKFAALPDGAEKTALAIKLFGKSGAEMIPLLNGGSNALAEMAREADALGLTINAKTGKAAEAFNDNLTRLKGALQGLTNQLLEALAPALVVLSDKIVALTAWFRNLSPETQKFLAWGAAITVVLGPALIALGALVSAIGLVTGAFATMTAVVLANPIIAAITAIAVGAALIYYNWDSIAQFFTDLWNTVSTATQAAWDSVAMAWEHSADAFSGWLTNVVVSFNTFWDQIKQVTAQWVTDFFQIGGNIVRGLQQGIAEQWDALVQWFYDKATAMSDSIKEAVGIQSPSKVFREIGQFITEGLALGVQDNVPMVDDAMGGVADAVNGTSGSLTSGMDEFKSSASNAFKSFVTGASTAQEAIGQLLDSLASSLMNSAFDGIFGSIGKALGFKNGAAFSGGKVKAFASGGVVNSPVAFPMKGGAGLMGEAGPEAIMPLTRIGGKLGVRMAGNGGGTTISIDARGAVEGTDALIMRRLQEAVPGLMRQAIGANRAGFARGY